MLSSGYGIFDLALYPLGKEVVEGFVKMKKIKYIMMACLLTASLSMEAKSMKDLLVSMPDEVMPCLNKNMRLEFAELQEMGVKAEVKNLLEEVSVMDTLTQDFVQIRMTKASTLQMKKLPVENGDSLLCVVKTFAGPEKESELYFYNQDWKKMDATRLLDGKRMEDLAESLIQKPDTMSETRFAELKAMIEPRMVSTLLLQNENSLVVRLSLPLLSADDKKAVNAIKLQRSFKWNGKTFKES